MDDKEKELDRIQKALLAEEEADSSLDELLDDEELTALLSPKPEPAFEDPDEIHEPAGQNSFQNFANGYGAQTRAKAARKKNDNILIGLMITASVLCLGIIGVLAYWLGVLL